MKPSLLKDTLKSLVKIRRSVVIEGPPGGGKTSIVHQVAREMDLPVIEVHMPTMLVEDFGIPFPESGKTQFGYKMPDWYPYEGKPGTEQGGILLFDDRNQAGHDIQKVLANILQARTLHGVPLAEKWSVVSTGNRQSDRAGANRILTHLRNRETVIELETDLDDSINWMVSNGVHPEVVSFLRFRPSMLHDFDPKRDANPTPRAWVEGVSSILGHIPRESEYECFRGAVGEAAAAEFVGFLRIYRELPDPDMVISNPAEAPVPENGAALYAIAGAIAYRVNEDTISNYFQYLDRIPMEFAAMSIRIASRMYPDIVIKDEFIEWSSRNSDVFS